MAGLHWESGQVKMSRLLLDIPSALQKRVAPLARQTGETMGQLALRLLQEYADDCEDAERISAEIDAGTMPTYSWQEVKGSLGLGS